MSKTSEAAEPSKRKKDLWDILDVFAKSVLAIAVTGGIGFYSIHVDQRLANDEKRRAEIAENSRRAQTVIQLVNARESANANLRSQMFSTLLDHYFKADDLDAQIAFLQLIGLNFRDAIQIKPMFERLGRQLDLVDAADREAHHRLLRQAARSIINDQLAQIDIAPEGATCELSMRIGDISTPDCFPLLAVKLRDVEADAIRVRTNISGGQRLDPSEIEEGNTFSVNYFDMPMVDYTRMVVGDSLFVFSLVLLETEPDESNRNNGRARVAVAVLPDQRFNGRFAYQFDDLLKDFITVLESGLIPDLDA